MFLKITISKILISALVLMGLFFTDNVILLAQSPGGWTVPERIPHYDDESRPPELVADSTGVIHVFNDQPVDDFSDAIFHRTWQPDTGWSEARDIILPLQSNRPRVAG